MICTGCPSSTLKKTEEGRGTLVKCISNDKIRVDVDSAQIPSFLLSLLSETNNLLPFGQQYCIMSLPEDISTFYFEHVDVLLRDIWCVRKDKYVILRINYCKNYTT